MHCLEMGTREQFATLREYFLRSGFTEEALRQRLDVKSGQDLDIVALSGRLPLERKPVDGLDALIYLFVLGEFLWTADAVSFFPGAVWEAMGQTSLVLSD